MAFRFGINDEKYLDLKFKEHRTAKEQKILDDAMTIHEYLNTHPRISLSENEYNQWQAAVNKQNAMEKILLQKAGPR